MSDCFTDIEFQDAVDNICNNFGYPNYLCIGNKMYWTLFRNLAWRDNLRHYLAIDTDWVSII